MSVLVTVLRVTNEKLQNNDPKMRIICPACTDEVGGFTLCSISLLKADKTITFHPGAYKTWMQDFFYLEQCSSKHFLLNQNNPKIKL